MLCIIYCLAGTPMLAPIQVQGQVRVGVGDSRVGYERSDFRTDSRQLPKTGEDNQDVGTSAEHMLGLPPLRLAPPNAEAVSLGRKLCSERETRASVCPKVCPPSRGRTLASATPARAQR